MAGTMHRCIFDVRVPNFGTSICRRRSTAEQNPLAYQITTILSTVKREREVLPECKELASGNDLEKLYILIFSVIPRSPKKGLLAKRIGASSSCQEKRHLNGTDRYHQGFG